MSITHSIEVHNVGAVRGVPTKTDALFLDIATRVSEESHAIRLRVGCVIEKDKQIISVGYNGTLPGESNNCEFIRTPNGEHVELSDSVYNFKLKQLLIQGELVTKPDVIHAEENAVCKLACSTISGKGATAYVTHAPCQRCAQLMVISGIKRVVFNNFYRDNTGLYVLSKNAVELSTPMFSDSGTVIEEFNNIVVVDPREYQHLLR